MTTDPKNYQPAPDFLKDRIILVTGAGDGIGAAAARSFASYGATVVLTGRTKAKLEAVYDAIVAAGDPQPAIFVIDFAKAQGDDYQNLHDGIEQDFGRLDGLLNNASVLGNLSPIKNYDIATWLEVMHVNLNAPFIVTQTLLPLLEKSADAAIIFTSSGVGRTGRALWGAYAVSKFGLEGLSQIVADEHDNMRVNALNPGRTRTAMRKLAYPGEDPMNLKVPDDVAGLFVDLAAPDCTRHGELVQPG